MAEVAAAALAVTGWFVSPLISNLAEKGLSIFKKDGMKGKLENLQNITVPQIKQVIEKAEMLGREDDKQLMMMVWLRELQDAAYEADNLLDEYDYELLKRQAKGKFVKTVSSPLSFVSDASFRSKLEDSLEQLDKIASRVHTFTNMLGGVSNAFSLDDETTFVTRSIQTGTEPRIFGRDTERDQILDLLINNHVTSESDHEIRDVLVPPIVGVGGVGKTALAQDMTNLVAMTLGRNAMQPIRLEGLNEHDCLSLFNSYAFEATAAACGQQIPDDHHLMEIGREITRKIISKLGGLPLAAKVLGGMLRNKHDVEEWNKVLRIDIWDDITRVLTLSYKRLPPLLQQCVAHHGLYPKGLSFSGDYLVRSWIAEGFISAAQHDEQESRDQSTEEIGSNCLKELVFRSFLQRRHDGRFVLHDLMHDVADFVSRHECIRIQKGEKKDLPPTTKHLCIHVEDLDEYKEYICRLKNLHTLFLSCDSKSNFTLDHGVLHSILNKSKRLRTLNLAACRIDKLPDSICDLKHLRFLKLSRSTVKTLPISFHRLYHLLYLDFSRVQV